VRLIPGRLHRAGGPWNGQARRNEEVSDTTRSIASLGLLVVALIAGACSSGARTVDERVTDAVITSTIQQRLAADPALGEAMLDVATAAGIVTLTGEVSREPLRARAEALAREVEGVQDVQNLIRVTGRGD